MPPRLRPGSYNIVATGNQGLRGELLLDVSSADRGAPSAFSMSLYVDPNYTWLQGKLQATKTEAPAERVQDFRGVLDGPAGGAIPGATIKVWKRDGPFETPLAETESDQGGWFWTHLSDGMYVAFFHEGGFQDKFLAFDVAMTGARSELWVSLSLEVDAGLQQAIALAKDRPPSERIQDFAGVVRDQGEGPIPGALIRVLKMSSEDDETPVPVVETASDQQGRFSAHLADGKYVAIFVEQGFKELVLMFEVAKGEGARELRVTMQIGATT